MFPLRVGPGDSVVYLSHEKVIVADLQADLVVLGKDRWGPGLSEAKSFWGTGDVTQLVEGLCCVHRPLDQSLAPHKLCIVEHTCNLNTWEEEAANF